MADSNLELGNQLTNMADSNKLGKPNGAQHKSLMRRVTTKNLFLTYDNNNNSYSDLLPAPEDMEWVLSDEDSSSKSSSNNTSPYGSLKDVSLDCVPLNHNIYAVDTSTPNTSLQQVDITYCSFIDRPPSLQNSPSNYPLDDLVQNDTSKSSIGVEPKYDT